MTNISNNLTWTGRSWQIVRSDTDLAHVFLRQNTLEFEPGTRKVGDKMVEGYRIVHTGPTAEANGFATSFLIAVGTHKAAFDTATNEDKLPQFSDKSATTYEDISDLLTNYVEQNRHIQRLEGVIEIPCHPEGTAAPKDTMPKHGPLYIKTVLHVYQFENVVDGSRPLLVLRAPLSPICPLNGDGTAIGYS